MFERGEGREKEKKSRASALCSRSKTRRDGESKGKTCSDSFLHISWEVQ